MLACSIAFTLATCVSKLATRLRSGSRMVSKLWRTSPVLVATNASASAKATLAFLTSRRNTRCVARMLSPAAVPLTRAASALPKVPSKIFRPLASNESMLRVTVLRILSKALTVLLIADKLAFSVPSGTTFFNTLSTISGP